MSRLREAYFLRDLGPRELERVEDLAQERRYVTGATLVEAYQEILYIYVVKEGHVQLVAPSDVVRGTAPREGEGAEAQPAEIGPGATFGDLAYADRQPAAANIVALEPTCVYALSHHDLDVLFANDGSIARKVLGAMLHRVVGQLRAADADLLLARYVLRIV